MKISLRTVFLLSFTLFASASLHAGTFKDGPFLGQAQLDDLDEETPIFGWQVAYEFNSLWSIELLGAWHEMTLAQGFPPGLEGSEADLQTGSLAAGLRASWGWPAFRFYLGAGGGVYLFDVSPTLVQAAPALRPPALIRTHLDTEASESYGLHAAIGAEWKISDRWEVFAEARHLALEATLQSTWITTQQHGDQATANATLLPDQTLPLDQEWFRLGIHWRF